MSHIYSLAPKRDPGYKFLIIYFLKSHPFLTPVPNFVFKCEYFKLEAYGKVGRNVRSLRKSCSRPRGSLLNTTLVVMTLARGGKPVMSPLPQVPVSRIVSLNGIVWERLFLVKSSHDGVWRACFTWSPAGQGGLECTFSVFCLAESCHREQVLSKQHEQGFELENEKGLNNTVIVVCLFKNCLMVHQEVIKKTRKYINRFESHSKQSSVRVS